MVIIRQRPSMTRSNRFITGLLSSYAAIGVNILFTLASVPLALHYLDKEEFGLWALVTQLSGYLMLLEFGMSGSVARSLSDHKDQIEDGIYGSILRTGARVFAIQGVLVALLGLAVAWFAVPFLGLPSRLQQPFTILMAAQAVLSGFRLSLGALGSPLWCHQRLDLSNLASSVSLFSTFAALWAGFHFGWHFYSLSISTAVGSLLGSLLIYYFCRRLGFYPSDENRGRFDPLLFRELFRFGGGLFMMNLGAQLASTSQVVIISRMLGMEAAAVWSISTKIFGFAQQFVSRVLDSSAGGLAEMVVRKESNQLKKRFHDLVSISAMMAVAASAGIALMNGAFVEIWTSGIITWNPWNDLLLACLLFSTAINRCHTSLVGISKQIKGMKYIYLLEGLIFVLMSVLLIPIMNFSGLLIAALLCNILLTGVYGVRHTSEYFDISPRDVIRWLMPSSRILLAIALLFVATCTSTLAQLNPTSRLIMGGAVFFVIIAPLIWFFGLDRDIRAEAIRFMNGIREQLKLKFKIV